jgi:hypothetical protein
MYTQCSMNYTMSMMRYTHMCQPPLPARHPYHEVMLVPCPAVETLVFSDRHDPEKAAGRKRDRAKRGLPDAEEWTSVDMADEPIANVLVGGTGW